MRVVVTVRHQLSSLILSMGIPTIEFGGVHEFRALIEFKDNLTDLQILETVFTLFNGMVEGRDATLWRLYQQAKMPSLSVGMLVDLDERTYLCTSHGWHRV